MVVFPWNRKPYKFSNEFSDIINQSNSISDFNINRINVEKQASIIIRLIQINKFQRVEEIIQTEIENQTRTIEGFYYANALMEEIFYNQFKSSLLVHLNKWIEQSPSSSLAYTARAYFYYKSGWVSRGHALVSDTSEEQARGYVEQVNLSAKDIAIAIELDSYNPLALIQILTLGRNGWADRDTFESYFQQIDTIVPYYLEAYQEKSDFLNPKWHGKNEAELLNFVRQSVDNAPRKTAIPLLLPQLHEELSLHQNRNRKKYYNLEKNWQEIENNYLRLIEDFPESGFYPLWFAEMARDAGKNRLARKYYRIALKKDTENLVLKEKLSNFKSR